MGEGPPDPLEAHVPVILSMVESLAWPSPGCFLRPWFCFSLASGLLKICQIATKFNFRILQRAYRLCLQSAPAVETSLLLYYEWLPGWHPLVILNSLYLNGWCLQPLPQSLASLLWSCVAQFILFFPKPVCWPWIIYHFYTSNQRICT